jgi:anaerobic nitric oxide reductase transcription regulator
VPPLREHPEDVALLAGHFADRARRRLGCGPIRVAADAREQLARGAWPGNVRELENALSRAILRALGRTPSGQTVIVRAADLGEAGPEPAPSGAAPSPAASPALPLSDAVRAFQRAQIERALAAADGNWAAAARALGLHRSNLHHLARRLGLR